MGKQPKITAYACLVEHYKQKTQFLSGYPDGAEKRYVWRVKLKIGNSFFVSDRIYKSAKSANAAAKRINGNGK